ncbi:MAG: shikimate kinase [bacterium]|nr:shikimate kinase [bacterium]
MKCGLLGRKLGHSYSPMLHALLGDYEYLLYEREPDEVEGFIRSGAWDAINVTIPYKKAVVPFLDELSEGARALGSVNTIVRRPDGTLFGDNTDVFGFTYMLRRSGVNPAGKKALVLGSGGASVTVQSVLRGLGAQVVVISRTGADNYDNLSRHRDARLIVNATPVGMYPNNGISPIDLAAFPACEGALDLIYNPARTAFLLQAEALGIPHENGLSMLAAQAKRASELFTGKSLPDEDVERSIRAVEHTLQNIVLIGMPGCGKSTLARLLGERLNRPVVELDRLIEETAGLSIPEIFAAQGESGFRALETQALREAGRRSGAILSTGGGCVTRPENYPLLHQNGRIVWLRRDVSLLPTAGRPLSQARSPEVIYRERRPLYERFADRTVDNDGPIEKTLEQILEVIS